MCILALLLESVDTIECIEEGSMMSLKSMINGYPSAISVYLFFVLVSVSPQEYQRA